MFVASCFPLRSGKESGASDLCHINALNMNYRLSLRDEYHAIRRSTIRNPSGNVYQRMGKIVMWIRFTYTDDQLQRIARKCMTPPRGTDKKQRVG